MNIAVTGHHGCIGSRLVNLGAASLLCDITVKEEVLSELERVRPDVIIHTAGMSSIDRCDEDYEKALTINQYGTSVVCEATEQVVGSGRVVVISTDQVFDGEAGPYSEKDEPNPIHSYGLSKLGAEAVAQLYGCKVLRISRCFDSYSSDISGYLKQLQYGFEIGVPDFFYRSYCHMDYVSEEIWRYANLFFTMPEILHLGGLDTISFYEFMRHVASMYGHDKRLVKPRGPLRDYSPRPRKCGLNTGLAVRLGVPVYTVYESVLRMKNE